MNQEKLTETIKRCTLLINKSCHYLSADIPDSLHEYRYIENNEIMTSMSKVLLVEITKDYYIYKKGRQFKLFFKDIWNTCVLFKKNDPGFAKRFDAGCLTENDIQKIFNKTTKNILRVYFRHNEKENS